MHYTLPFGLCLSAVLSVSAASHPSGLARVPRSHFLRSKAKREGTAYAGKAYYGAQNGVAGSCGAVHTDQELLVGLQIDTFANGMYCGQEVMVLNKATNKTVNAKVTDSCSANGDACSDPNDIYLSQAAFTAIGSIEDGVIDIVWTFANVPAQGVAPPMASASGSMAAKPPVGSVVAPPPPATVPKPSGAPSVMPAKPATFATVKAPTVVTATVTV